jgi:hypothetical protein
MLPDQLRDVAAKYVAILRTRGYMAVKADTSSVSSPESQLNHTVWMCEQLSALVGLGELEKAGRWLGFVQGILWGHNILTIDQMRDDNRS